MRSVEESRERCGVERFEMLFIHDPAAAIKAVCDRLGVSLAAAALQFPLHHPTVSCVCIGARIPEQARTNDERLRVRIPDGLWAELKYERLLPEDAPTP